MAGSSNELTLSQNLTTISADDVAGVAGAGAACCNSAYHLGVGVLAGGSGSATNGAGAIFVGVLAGGLGLVSGVALATEITGVSGVTAVHTGGIGNHCGVLMDAVAVNLVANVVGQEGLILAPVGIAGDDIQDPDQGFLGQSCVAILIGGSNQLLPVGQAEVVFSIGFHIVKQGVVAQPVQRDLHSDDSHVAVGGVVHAVLTQGQSIQGQAAFNGVIEGEAANGADIVGIVVVALGVDGLAVDIAAVDTLILGVAILSTGGIHMLSFLKRMFSLGVHDVGDTIHLNVLGSDGAGECRSKGVIEATQGFQHIDTLCIGGQADGIEPLVGILACKICVADVDIGQVGATQNEGSARAYKRTSQAVDDDALQAGAVSECTDAHEIHGGRQGNGGQLSAAGECIVSQAGNAFANMQALNGCNVLKPGSAAVFHTVVVHVAGAGDGQQAIVVQAPGQIIATDTLCNDFQLTHFATNRADTIHEVVASGLSHEVNLLSLAADAGIGSGAVGLTAQFNDLTVVAVLVVLGIHMDTATLAVITCGAIGNVVGIGVDMALAGSVPAGVLVTAAGTNASGSGLDTVGFAIFCNHVMSNDLLAVPVDVNGDFLSATTAGAGLVAIGTELAFQVVAQSSGQDLATNGTNLSVFAVGFLTGSMADGGNEVGLHSGSTVLIGALVQIVACIDAISRYGFHEHTVVVVSNNGQHVAAQQAVLDGCLIDGAVAIGNGLSLADEDMAVGIQRNHGAVGITHQGAPAPLIILHVRLAQGTVGFHQVGVGREGAEGVVHLVRGGHDVDLTGQRIGDHGHVGVVIGVDADTVQAVQEGQLAGFHIQDVDGILGAPVGVGIEDVDSAVQANGHAVDLLAADVVTVVVIGSNVHQLGDGTEGHVDLVDGGVHVLVCDQRQQAASGGIVAQVTDLCEGAGQFQSAQLGALEGGAIDGVEVAFQVVGVDHAIDSLSNPQGSLGGAAFDGSSVGRIQTVDHFPSIGHVVVSQEVSVVCDDGDTEGSGSSVAFVIGDGTGHGGDAGSHGHDGAVSLNGNDFAVAAGPYHGVGGAGGDDSGGQHIAHIAAEVLLASDNAQASLAFGILVSQDVHTADQGAGDAGSTQRNGSASVGINQAEVALVACAGIVAGSPVQVAGVHVKGHGAQHVVLEAGVADGDDLLSGGNQLIENCIQSDLLPGLPIHTGGAVGNTIQSAIGRSGQTQDTHFITLIIHQLHSGQQSTGAQVDHVQVGGSVADVCHGIHDALGIVIGQVIDEGEVLTHLNRGNNIPFGIHGHEVPATAPILGIVAVSIDVAGVGTVLSAVEEQVSPLASHGGRIGILEPQPVLAGTVAHIAGQVAVDGAGALQDGNGVGGFQHIAGNILDGNGDNSSAGGNSGNITDDIDGGNSFVIADEGYLGVVGIAGVNGNIGCLDCAGDNRHILGGHALNSDLRQFGNHFGDGVHTHELEQLQILRQTQEHNSGIPGIHPNDAVVLNRTPNQLVGGVVIAHGLHILGITQAFQQDFAGQNFLHGAVHIVHFQCGMQMDQLAQAGDGQQTLGAPGQAHVHFTGFIIGGNSFVCLLVDLAGHPVLIEAFTIVNGVHGVLQLSHSTIVQVNGGQSAVAFGRDGGGIHGAGGVIVGHVEGDLVGRDAIAQGHGLIGGQVVGPELAIAVIAIDLAFVAVVIGTDEIHGAHASGGIDIHVSQVQVEPGAVDHLAFGVHCVVVVAIDMAVNIDHADDAGSRQLAAGGGDLHIAIGNSGNNTVFNGGDGLVSRAPGHLAHGCVPRQRGGHQSLLLAHLHLQAVVIQDQHLSALGFGQCIVSLLQDEQTDHFGVAGHGERGHFEVINFTVGKVDLQEGRAGVAVMCPVDAVIGFAVGHGLSVVGSAGQHDIVFLVVQQGDYFVILIQLAHTTAIPQAHIQLAVDISNAPGAIVGIIGHQGFHLTGQQVHGSQHDGFHFVAPIILHGTLVQHIHGIGSIIEGHIQQIGAQIADLVTVPQAGLHPDQVAASVNCEDQAVNIVSGSDGVVLHVVAGLLGQSGGLLVDGLPAVHVVVVAHHGVVGIVDTVAVQSALFQFGHIVGNGKLDVVDAFVCAVVAQDDGHIGAVISDVKQHIPGVILVTSEVETIQLGIQVAGTGGVGQNHISQAGNVGNSQVNIVSAVLSELFHILQHRGGNVHGDGNLDGVKLIDINTAVLIVGHGLDGQSHLSAIGQHVALSIGEVIHGVAGPAVNTGIHDAVCKQVQSLLAEGIFHTAQHIALSIREGVSNDAGITHQGQVNVRQTVQIAVAIGGDDIVTGVVHSLGVVIGVGIDTQDPVGLAQRGPDDMLRLVISGHSALVPEVLFVPVAAVEDGSFVPVAVEAHVRQAQVHAALFSGQVNETFHIAAVFEVLFEPCLVVIGQGHDHLHLSGAVGGNGDGIGVKSDGAGQFTVGAVHELHAIVVINLFSQQAAADSVGLFLAGQVVDAEAESVLAGLLSIIAQLDLGLGGAKALTLNGQVSAGGNSANGVDQTGTLLTGRSLHAGDGIDNGNSGAHQQCVCHNTALVIIQVGEVLTQVLQHQGGDTGHLRSSHGGTAHQAVLAIVVSRHDVSTDASQVGQQAQVGGNAPAGELTHLAAGLIGNQAGLSGNDHGVLFSSSHSSAVFQGDQDTGHDGLGNAGEIHVEVRNGTGHIVNDQNTRSAALGSILHFFHEGDVTTGDQSDLTGDINALIVGFFTQAGHENIFQLAQFCQSGEQGDTVGIIVADLNTIFAIGEVSRFYHSVVDTGHHGAVDVSTGGVNGAVVGVRSGVQVQAPGVHQAAGVFVTGSDGQDHILLADALKDFVNDGAGAGKARRGAQGHVNNVTVQEQSVFQRSDNAIHHGAGITKDLHDDDLGIGSHTDGVNAFHTVGAGDTGNMGTVITLGIPGVISAQIPVGIVESKRNLTGVIQILSIDLIALIGHHLVSIQVFQNAGDLLNAQRSSGQFGNLCECGVIQVQAGVDDGDTHAGAGVTAISPNGGHAGHLAGGGSLGVDAIILSGQRLVLRHNEHGLDAGEFGDLNQVLELGVDGECIYQIGKVIAHSQCALSINTASDGIQHSLLLFHQATGVSLRDFIDVVIGFAGRSILQHDENRNHVAGRKGLSGLCQLFQGLILQPTQSIRSQGALFIGLSLLIFQQLISKCLAGFSGFHLGNTVVGVTLRVCSADHLALSCGGSGAHDADDHAQCQQKHECFSKVHILPSLLFPAWSSGRAE